MRLDDFYAELLDKLIEKDSTDKSKVIRAALMYYAHYQLEDDEILNLQLKHIGRF